MSHSETLWTVAHQAPLYPWDSPGNNTRVGCHALLQGIFLTQGSNPCLLSCIAGRFFTAESPGSLSIPQGLSKIHGEETGAHKKGTVSRFCLASCLPQTCPRSLRSGSKVPRYPSVLTPWDFHNKVPKARWLKIEMHCLTVLKAGVQHRGAGRAVLSVTAAGQTPSSRLLDLLAFASTPWPLLPYKCITSAM